MTKKGNLSAALGQFDRRAQPDPDPAPAAVPAQSDPAQAPPPAPAARPAAPRKASAPEPAAKTPQPPSRQGKKALTAYFAPEVLKQLKVMAAAGDTTVQALLTEALNDLFKKHGKPHIA